MKKAYIAPECTNVQMPENFCESWNINGSPKDFTQEQF